VGAPFAVAVPGEQRPDCPATAAEPGGAGVTCTNEIVPSELSSSREASVKTRKETPAACIVT
jgi:hypothetical protein